MDKQLVRLSKKLSFVLRHQPERIGISLDQFGRVDLQELIQKFNQHYQTPIDTKKIAQISAQSNKQRFAIEGNTIRALYGHSIPVKPLAKKSQPPMFLYHGTSHLAAGLIMQDGLKKMERSFVHLSADFQNAKQVGQRHDPHPVILKIKAQQAASAGILFYPTKSGVWLTDYLPPQFILPE